MMYNREIETNNVKSDKAMMVAFSPSGTTQAVQTEIFLEPTPTLNSEEIIQKMYERQIPSGNMIEGNSPHAFDVKPILLNGGADYSSWLNNYCVKKKDSTTGLMVIDGVQLNSDPITQIVGNVIKELRTKASCIASVIIQHEKLKVEMQANTEFVYRTHCQGITSWFYKNNRFAMSKKEYLIALEDERRVDEELSKLNFLMRNTQSTMAFYQKEHDKMMKQKGSMFKNCAAVALVATGSALTGAMALASAPLIC